MCEYAYEELSGGLYRALRSKIAKRIPSGPNWVHEIKHDGYRLMARKQRNRVRLYTRNGHDWASRYPTIVKAVLALKVENILIDGEAVICDRKGVADFYRLHSRAYDAEACLYAFDLLELNGAEVGLEPFEARKKILPKVLRKPPLGVMLSEHTDDDGDLIFKHACKLGLEGIVSKRRDLPCRSGRVKGRVPSPLHKKTSCRILLNQMQVAQSDKIDRCCRIC